MNLFGPTYKKVTTKKTLQSPPPQKRIETNYTTFCIRLHKEVLSSHCYSTVRLFITDLFLPHSLRLALFARFRRKSKSNMTRNMPRNKLIHLSKVIPLHSYEDGSLIAGLLT